MTILLAILCLYLRRDCASIARKRCWQVGGVQRFAREPPSPSTREARGTQAAIGSCCVLAKSKELNAKIMYLQQIKENDPSTNHEQPADE